MFQITKNEPCYFTETKNKVILPEVHEAWSDMHISKIRSKLREDILLREQNLLCAYCEKKIDSNSKNSNIDHFKTKNLFSEKTLDYNNLLVSCNTKGRCSDYKDNHIKNKSDYDNIVNPIVENPDDFFDYLLTGEIVSINDNKKANFTIDIFNLGRNESNSLTQTRRRIAEALKNCTNLSIDETYSVFGNEFYSFINIIYRKLKSKGVIA